MFYEVEIIDGEACIVGFTDEGLRHNRENGRMPEFPLEFDGLPVTRIGDYAFLKKKITKLPKSWGNITTLGKAAFMGNEIPQLPEDWGIVSTIRASCFRCNNIEGIPEWGIVQEVGIYAFYKNEIREINDWGDLQVINKGTFQGNNIEELTASFRNIRWIRTKAFAENNILSEIGDMYMVPEVEPDVFDENPGDGILYTKYLNENKYYRRTTGE